MIPAVTHRAQGSPSSPWCAQTGWRFLPRPPVDQFAGGLHVVPHSCASSINPLAGAGCEADRQLLSHDQPQRTDPSRIGEMRRFRSGQSSGVVGHEPQDRPLRRAGLFHRRSFMLISSLTGRGFGSGPFSGIGRGRANVPDATIFNAADDRLDNLVKPLPAHSSVSNRYGTHHSERLTDEIHADLGDLLAEADRLAAKVKAAKEALK